MKKKLVICRQLAFGLGATLFVSYVTGIVILIYLAYFAIKFLIVIIPELAGGVREIVQELREQDRRKI